MDHEAYRDQTRADYEGAQDPLYGVHICVVIHGPAVRHGNDRMRPESCFPNPLPIPTKILAHGAKLDGGFGLVWRVITIAYHPADLGLPLSCEAFTNHYLRGQGQDIDSDVVAGRQHQVAGWAGL